MNLAFRAMEFAREVHKDQKRKYTENPYVDHLAEVAGIVAAAGVRADTVWPFASEQMAVPIAVAWLHDCIEDQGVLRGDLYAKFGEEVASGVQWLSDMEAGNRASRKAASRARLAQAPGWIQAIKCADLISNTSSIVQHDPDFAVVYLKEKRLLLDVLTKADPRLLAIARSQSEVA